MDETALTLLAQISDTHIREPGQLAYGRIDTAPYLRDAIATYATTPDGNPPNVFDRLNRHGFWKSRAR